MREIVGWCREDFAVGDRLADASRRGEVKIPTLPQKTREGRGTLDLFRYGDQGFGAGENFADVGGGNFRGLKGFHRGGACWRGDQKAAGGLRIIEQGLYFVRDAVVVTDYALGEVAIVFEAGGDVAGADAVESSGE